MTINQFTGPYRFLSNFYPARVVLDGDEYPTVEHAYQAAKTDIEREVIRRAPTPGIARKLGRMVMVRSDWEVVKVEIMRGLLKQKFSDPKLRQMLLDTGDAELVEGNWWNDTFWGKYKGEGKNMLGVMLMLIRDEGKP